MSETHTAMAESRASGTDALGVICSSLCLAHCLLLPLLLPLLIATGALGTVGATLASEQAHLILLLPVALLAVLSFPSGYRLHGRLLPSILALLGLTGLVLALVLGETSETWLTSIGAAMLIIAHLRNRKLLNG